MVLYIVIGVLVGGLALASFAALVVGVLALIGGVRLERCSHCRHLFAAPTAASDGGGAQSTVCPFCRHGRLFHPIATLHHAHERLPAGHSL